MMNVNCKESVEKRGVGTKIRDTRFQKLYNQYKDLQQDIVFLQDKIRSLREITEYSSPSLEGLGGKGCCNDKVGGNTGKIVDLQKELGEKQVQLLNLWDTITDMIHSLNNSTQRRIMTERYINQKKWEQIAEETNLCERWVFRLHRKALEMMEQ